MLSGWAQFLSFLFLVCLLLLGFRWVRRRLMWRLRNRLIVTYVFIGVIPILLLVSMGLLAGYLFAGQFATYIALSDLQTELDHLQSANNALTTQFRSLAREQQPDAATRCRNRQCLRRKLPSAHGNGAGRR